MISSCRGNLIGGSAARTLALSLAVGMAACGAESAIPSEGGAKPTAEADAGGGDRQTSSAVAEESSVSSKAGFEGVREGPAVPVGEQAIARSPDHLPAPPRLVAFGDVHGDLEATLAALRLAGAIDGDQNWSGGDLVLVQTGDQLDRGDDEPEILALFEKLQVQAEAAGGAFHVLNGNHEVMNAMTDLRYVTPEGLTDFAGAGAPELPPELREQVPAEMRGRVASFLPGSPNARSFARRNIVIVVGETVFVHGGLTPRWAEYGIDRINSEASAYLSGARSDRPEVLTADDGPLWSRHFSDQPDEADCALLEQSLELVGAKRMVVGHTVIMEGIRSECGERVWMVDVGMAAYYGGKPAALEITSDGVRPLSG